MRSVTFSRLLSVCLGLGLLAALVVASIRYDVPIPYLTRDVSAIAHLSPFAGVLSALGIMLWVCAATIWGIGATLHKASDLTEAKYMACASAFTFYLALDDQFQIHEEVAPNILGVPELIIHILIATAAIGVCWLLQKGQKVSDRRMLGASVGLLAASMLIDVSARFQTKLGHWQFLLEDGFKWLGIVCWCRYAWERSILSVSRRPPR